MCGHRPLKHEDERDWPLARIAEKPDLTFDALVAELGERRGIVVVRDTLWRFLGSAGFRSKTNRSRQRAGST